MDNKTVAIINGVPLSQITQAISAFDTGGHITADDMAPIEFQHIETPPPPRIFGPNTKAYQNKYHNIGRR